MKTTRIILVCIFLTIILLPYQIGQSQYNPGSINLNISTSVNRPDTNSDTIFLPLINKPWLNPQTGSCHFGITVLYGMTGYDLSLLGVETYLDWGNKNKNNAVADNIQYIRVINVGDASYASNLNALPTKLATYPGSVWIIGNEPDSEVTFQDHISAETYAEPILRHGHAHPGK